MASGLFPASSWIATKAQPLLVPRCGSCGLYRHCNSKKMPVAGKGRKGILVVGEAPGQQEDLEGLPFQGVSGQLLQRTLAEFDVDLFRDCWVTNSLICHPKEKDGSNRTPTDKEISFCRPNVIRAIESLKPRVVILLGVSAVKSVIGWLWQEDVGPIGRWVGWQIPSQKIKSWICPTWHPSFVLRNERGQQDEVTGLLFRQHLKAACQLVKKPVPEHLADANEVDIILDIQQAVEMIEYFQEDNRPVAFDYECNGLKPDSENMEIVCCSMSDGHSTIAYPWHGKAIEATREFLCSDVPKIASNLKYEERWSMRKLGLKVKNWAFDTMLAAHTLDNRPGISGLKFQAFVQLGVGSWNDRVKPFLESSGSNEPNRIREVDLLMLLHYCATDSLYEWWVARIQAKQLGIKL